MKTLKKTKLVPAMLIAATLSVESWAGAAPSSIKSGDWMMTDSNPGDFSTGSCTAVTAGYFGKDIMDLIVRLDKTGARPIEVLLRPRSRTSTVKAFRASSASGRSVLFQKLADSSFGQTIFWYIPNGTDDLLTQFKRTNQFNLAPVGAAGVIPFSMKGSSGALRAMLANCAGPKVLFQTSGFEQAFLPANIGAVNASLVSADSASAARDTITSAVKAYNNVLQVQAELAQLEAKYAAINAERNSLTATLSNLAAQLSSLTQQKVSAQNTIDTANREINDLNGKIATKQQELVQAQAAAAAAVTAISPFVPEHQRLLKIVTAKQSDLNLATNRLASLDQRIQSDTYQVNALSSEINDLNGRIRDRQNQEYQVRIQLDQAQRDSNNFNPDYEVRTRVAMDYQINNLNRAIGDQQRQSSQLEQQVNLAQGAKTALEGAYNECMANAGTNRLNAMVGSALDVSGGRGDRPREGGPAPFPGPGRPNPPSPAPVMPAPAPAPTPVVSGPDCSGLATQLAAANAQLDQSRQSLQQLQNSIAGLLGQKDDAIRAIQRQVNDIQRQLVERVNRLNQNVNDLQNEIVRMNLRLNDVMNSDLPQAQSDLANAQTLRPQVVTDLQVAQTAFYAATNDYRSYNTSVNYDALQATVDQTANTVATIKNTIANFMQQVASRENLIVEKTNLRDSLSRQINATNASIAANNNRLAQVEQSLVPYNSDKAEVMGRLNDKQSVLSQITAKFAKSLSL